MAAIEVTDLRMRYRSTEALGGISFTVEAGEVFALLGPNGAGKTTTVEILEGHRRRTGGQVSVLGFDPEHGGRAYRERIGIVLQAAGIDAELSVAEVLRLYARCYPHPRAVDDVLELVGLTGRRRVRVGLLSGGEQRRVDLALALIGDPDLIFLDEPTVGFDPGARRSAWELLDNLRTLGRTIVLTTHYMDEVQHLADRAVVLAGGEIVAAGNPRALGEDIPHATIVSFRLPDPADRRALAGVLGEPVKERGPSLTVTTVHPTAVLNRLTDWALTKGIELEALQVQRPSLEDVYLQLTGGHDSAR